jgi:hypothetical protein
MTIGESFRTPLLHKSPSEELDGRAGATELWRRSNEHTHRRERLQGCNKKVVQEQMWRWSGVEKPRGGRKIQQHHY